MGMVNQIVVTAHFGAGADMDAYFVSSALPMLIASLLASALEQAVVPAFARERARKTPEQASRFFSTMLNLLLVTTALITVLMIVFRSQMIFVSAPGLDPARMRLAVALAPFVFPTFLLLIGVNFIDDILNAEGQFGWPAYAGILVPLTTVIFVLVTGAANGVVILCIGAVVGLILQLSVVIFRLRESGLHYQPVMDVRSPELGLVLIALWPALGGSLVAGASPIVDQMFASSLTAGSISALNYSLKLVSVPTGIIFAAIGRAALPYLSRQAAASDMRAFKATLRLYLWITSALTGAVALFMFVAAHLIVRILFQRGAFTPEQTATTAVTLQGFVIGLTPMAVTFVTARAFSALRNTRVLMYVAIVSVLTNALFDFIFGHFWQSFGIALATSLVYVCSTALFLVTLRRQIGALDLLTPPAELVSALRTYEALQQVWLDRGIEQLRVVLHEGRVYTERVRNDVVVWYGLWSERGLDNLERGLHESRLYLASVRRDIVAKVTPFQMSGAKEPASDNSSQAQSQTKAGLDMTQFTQGLPARSDTPYVGSIPRWLTRTLICVGSLVAVIALGMASAFTDPTLALRIAVGVPLIVLFWRYPYVLLLSTVAVEILFGSSLSFLSGNNLATALTVPGLLLMISMPLKKTAQRMPALVIWTLFMVWVLAGIGLSPLSTIDFLKSWTLTLNYIVIAVLIINVVTTRRRLTIVVDVILVIAALIALYGIYGYVTHQHGQVDDSTGLFRITSIFSLATALAFHLTMVIPLAIFRIITLKGSKRLFVLGLLLVLLLALGLTYTRAALLAIPLCIAVQTIFAPSRRLKAGVFAGGIALAGILTLLSLLGITNFFARFLNSDLGTLNGRTYLWQAVLDHFDPWQILGRGLGASDALLTSLHIGENGVTSSSLIGTSPHSVFLGTLYDQGVVGFVLLTLAFAVLIVNLFKCAMNAKGEHRALAAAALAVLIPALIQSIDSNQLMIPELGLYFWIIVALPFARCWTTLRPSGESTSKRPPEPPSIITQWRPRIDPVLAAVPVSSRIGNTNDAHQLYRRVNTSPITSRFSMGQRWTNRNAKPRIFIVAAEFYPSVGGSEQQSRMQARMLQERGYDTTVVTFRLAKAWERYDAVDGVPVIRIAGWLVADRDKRPALLRKVSYVLGQVAMAWTLWRRRREYDVLHVYKANVLALFAAVTCRLTGKPMIVGAQSSGPDISAGTVGSTPPGDSLTSPAQPTLSAHEQSSMMGDLDDLARFGSMAVRLCRHLLRRNGAVVVSLSSRMRMYFASRGFNLPGSVVIPNGVDIHRFTPAPQTIESDPRDHTVICVSKLRYEKGVDVLLRAWRLVHTELPQARLIIVGDGPLKEYLEQLVSELDIADVVEFMGRRSDVPQQFHRAGVAVLSSRYEGMPNAVLEAMASALPCVATRVSGTEDIIQDNVNGLLVEPSDVDGLAEALLTLVRSPALARRFGRAARLTIEQRFAVEGILERYEALYQRLARRRKRTA